MLPSVAMRRFRHGAAERAFVVCGHLGFCTAGLVGCVPQDGWGESAAEAPSAAPVSAPWSDNYERASVGPSYRATSSVWHVEQGRLCAHGSRNHPLWLLPALPENVRIEFDAESATAEGDIKVEVFGDGRSFAQTTAYTGATSYLVIFGGWRNQFHVLSRMNEHDPQRLERRLVESASEPELRPLRARQTYHFKIERSAGKTLRVWLNGALLFTFTDSDPLRGRGHQHFGFNNWEARVCFDNLKITPL